MYKYIKANSFNEHLIDVKLRSSFNVKEVEGCVGFQTEPTISGSTCEILILISDAYDVDVIYTFAELSNMEKQDDIIRLLNELNSTYKLNYSLRDNGYIQATFEYISTVNDFNPELLLNYVLARYKNIKEETYAKVMKAMWN